jgi:aminoglycoside phosphotransferase (APT) family kinase protein
LSNSEIDPAGLLAAAGVADIGEIEQVLVGWGGASVWRVETAEGPYALRIFPRQWDSDRDRELAFMRLAFEHGLPAPWQRAAGDWHGHPWMLVTWLPGELVADVALRRAHKAKQLGSAFGRMQAELHAVTKPAEGAPVAGDWREWAGPIDDRLRAALDTTQPRENILLHFDYHPLNTLTERGRISAVLDWENARFGDPRADLARTYVILRFVSVLNPDPRLWFDWALRRFARAWWAAYSAAAGEPSNMRPYITWAWTTLYADLAPKLGRDGVGLTEQQLAFVKSRMERHAL